MEFEGFPLGVSGGMRWVEEIRRRVGRREVD